MQSALLHSLSAPSLPGGINWKDFAPVRLHHSEEPEQKAPVVLDHFSAASFASNLKIGKVFQQRSSFELWPLLTSSLLAFIEKGFDGGYYHCISFL